VSLTSDDPGSLAPPTAIGPFRVLHQVGAGVLGPVFRAHSADTDTEVAVKLFRLDLTPEQGRGLASALGRLCTRLPDHPHIIAGRTTGVIGATAWLASAFVAADALDTRLRRRALVGLRHALPLLRQVASALDAAAAVGIHHGALHPRDVLVTTTGQAHVTGFGIAEALIAVGLVPPARRPYAAPERLAEPTTAPDAAADVFSLGALAVEMLTGRRASGTGASAVGFVSGVSEGVDADVCRRALGRALAEAPGDRFSSAGALVAALAHALTEQPDADVVDTVADAGAGSAIEAVDTITAVEVPESPAPADAPREEAMEEPRRPAAPRGRRSPRPVAQPAPAAEEVTLPPASAGLTSAYAAEGATSPESPGDAAGAAPTPVGEAALPSARPVEPSAPESGDTVVGPQPGPQDELIVAGHPRDLDLFGLTAPEPSGRGEADDGDRLPAPTATGEAHLVPAEPDEVRPDRAGRQGAAGPGAAHREGRPVPFSAGSSVRTREEGPLPMSGPEPDGEWSPGTPPQLDDRLKRGGAFSVEPGRGFAAGARRASAGDWARLLAVLFAGIALGLLAGYGFWGVRPAPGPGTAATTVPAPPAAGTGAPAVPTTPAGDLAGTSSPAVTPPVATAPGPPAAAGGSSVVAEPLPARPGPMAVAPRGSDARAGASRRAGPPATAPSRREAAERRPAAAGPGTLDVVSRPAGARVFLDGNLVGTTPLTGTRAAAGSHRIRLELAGYAPWAATVRVAAGERARVTASLEPSVVR
jgi:hypothetical protein